jgi:hypothetical protein
VSDELDLDAIEARVNAATPAPWEVPTANVFRVVAPGQPHHNAQSGLAPPYPWRLICETGPYDQEAADFAFIAAARTDIPALVAEVRRLRAALNGHLRGTDS